MPQALAGYRPQLVASLSYGLQAVRNLLPDNTIQGATLKPWVIGLTVTQTLFNGYKTANSVRVAEFQVQSGREALRNVGEGVLLDAVTALSQCARQPIAGRRAALQRRVPARDVADHATASQGRRRYADRHVAGRGRLSRGLSDLNAAEVNFAVSQATYAQVIGNSPSQLKPADVVDRYLPHSREDAITMALKENPAVVAAGFDVDVATTSISVAESSLLPTVTLQGNVSHSAQDDPTLSTFANRPGLGGRLGQCAAL